MSLASKYQQLSVVFQGKAGNDFIREIKPRPGDDILDFGCGTGELSAVLTDLVVPKGSVRAGDQDVERVNLARKAHKEKRNLMFEVGSSFGFPGEGTEAYDLVFSNFVLHWIPNAQELFVKIYNSLKKGARVAMQFVHLNQRTNDFLEAIGRKDQLGVLHEKFCFDENDAVVRRYLEQAGFNEVLVTSWEKHTYLDSIHDLYELVAASFKGVVDISGVSKDQLDHIAPLFEENGKVCIIAPLTRFVATKV